MAIVDKYGKPFKKDKLQTSETKSYGRTKIEHPSLGMTIRRLPQILAGAEAGDLATQAHLFNDMLEKDGHIFAEMSKRRNALLTLDWFIHSPQNTTAEEKKLSELLINFFNEIDIDNLILELTDSIGHGFCAAEIEWHRDDYWLPASIRARPQYWFSYNTESSQLLLLNDAMGEPLWDYGWLVHQHAGKSGFLPQAGLYRVLAWTFLFKNFSLLDWAQFLDVYGLPIRIGKHPDGWSDEEIDSLLQTLVDVGREAVGAIPQNSSLEFFSPASGDSAPYENLVSWAERTQSKIILGGTLTSQADGKTSTNALGTVHNQVRHDLLVSDAKQIESTLNQLINLIAEVNGFNVKRLPKFEFNTKQLEDFVTFSTGISTLVSAGVDSIPVSWVHEKLGIPFPKDNEPTLKVNAIHSPIALSQHTGIAALSSTKSSADVAQLAIDNATLPDDAINAAMQHLLLPAITALKNGETPDDVIASLAEKYTELDDSQLQQLLTNILFVSDIWGRIND